MSWLDFLSGNSEAKANIDSKAKTANIPEGVWTKCDDCQQVLYRVELEKNLFVCPKCGAHMRISARQRLMRFLDITNQQELGQDLEPQDILKFKDSKRYKDRIADAQRKTNEKDALVVIKGTLKGIPVVCCAFEFNFNVNDDPQQAYITFYNEDGEEVGTYAVPDAVQGENSVVIDYESLPANPGETLTWDVTVVLFNFRRSPYAGVSVFSDADGQDQCCPGQTFQTGSALRFCSYQPYHGRCFSKSCHAR